MLIRTLGADFSEILSEIHTFSFKTAFENVVCEMVAIVARPQCVKLNSMIYSFHFKMEIRVFSDMYHLI